MTSARFEQTGSPDPVPAAPTQLTATGYFNGVEFRINLAVDGQRDQRVLVRHRALPGRGLLQLRGDRARPGENATGFRDAPLAAGATYTYRVRAIGFTGNSGYSNTATATTPAIDPPAAPSNLVATFSGSAVQLTWTDNRSTRPGSRSSAAPAAPARVFMPLAAVGANVTGCLDASWSAGRTTRIACARGIRRVFGLLQRGEREHAAGRARRAHEPGRQLEHPPPDRPSPGPTPPPARRRSPWSAAPGARARGSWPWPARGDGDVLGRRGAEVGHDLSLSRVRLQCGGELAVFERLERDGALMRRRPKYDTASRLGVLNPGLSADILGHRQVRRARHAISARRYP